MRGCRRVALERSFKRMGSSAGGMTVCEMGDSQGGMTAARRGKRTDR